MISKHTPRKLVVPAFMDPDNSVDLIDANRRNKDGDKYCVAAAILGSQVDEYWQDYLKALAEGLA